MPGWIALALLATSWLWGMHYFAPAQVGWYLVALAGSVVLLAIGFRRWEQRIGWEKLQAASPGQKTLPRAANRNVERSVPEPEGRSGEEFRLAGGLWRQRGLGISLAVLLFLPVWFWPWPQKTGPVLMLAGWLLGWLADRWPGVGEAVRRLTKAALLAGTILVLQAWVLEAYQAHTARSHELPVWLRPVAVGLAKLLDAEATATDADLVFRVLGQVHRIGLCWEWLLDPASVLFFTGGLVWLAWRCGESVPAGRRWACWLAGFRRLTGLMLLWIPVRWMLVLGLYLHRASLEGIGGEHLAIAQMFSPWFQGLLLLAPAVLAGRWLGEFPIPIQWLPDSSELKYPSAQSAHSAKPKEAAGDPGVSSAETHRLGLRIGWPAVWSAAGAALVAASAGWTPVGQPKQGRVLVVERHSQWEPTLRPYDTTWYGEPSGYNYRVIYDFCSHFFQMGRILESEPITDDRLQECDILIIKTPTAPYQPEEIEAVQRFVARGGGLLLIGDHTNVFRSSTYLNAICRAMGFTFRNDLLFCIGSPYEQAYRRPWPVHPAVQHVEKMDFAVSCSVDPGRSWGRAAIRSTGLWSLPAAYQSSNYHPQAEYLPHLRAGAFVQLWAATHGQGRVLAFTDSTIFSNFCIFQPGKAELFLNMLQWLNHTSPLDPWPVQAAVSFLLAGVGLVLVGLGCWKAYPPLAATEPTPASPEASAAGKKGGKSKAVAESAPASAHSSLSAPLAVSSLSGHLAASSLSTHLAASDGGLTKALVLLAACLAGATATQAGLQAYYQWAMPPMEPQTPYRLAVIDRTVSQVPLANGAFNQSPDGFGLLEHTIPRLGYFTARREGSTAFEGDLLVVIAPSRSVPHGYREQLIEYVAQGGKLLVIDHPGNTHSTAQSLLEPFGLRIRHDRLTSAGALATAGRSSGISVESACTVSGGEGVVYVGQEPVAARVGYGQGSVLAIGFGQIWTDGQMHSEWRANWMPEPTRPMLARYGLFYSLFRALAEGGPIKPVELPTSAPGIPEAPKTPEAPLVPEAPGVPPTPSVPERPPVPERPSVPQTPSVPERSAVPEAPLLPDVPPRPKPTPTQKEMPKAEAGPAPEAPPVPEVPGSLEKREKPAGLKPSRAFRRIPSPNPQPGSVEQP